MKVKDIVNNLNKFYAPDDDLVIAWWDTEYFAEDRKSTRLNSSH